MKIKTINETLLELVAGILACCVLCQFTVVWLVKDKGAYSLGLWIGAAVAVFMAYHMWRSLDMSLGLDEGGAQKALRRHSLFRYGIVVLIFGILMCTKAVNPLASFLGVMCLKAAAYIQPFTHKAIQKIRR